MISPSTGEQTLSSNKKTIFMLKTFLWLQCNLIIYSKSKNTQHIINYMIETDIYSASYN